MSRAPDPTARRVRVAGGRTGLAADTAGFVRLRPHQLVESFRSTLDEVADADFMLHLVDASDSDPDGRIRAVRAVLADIDARIIGFANHTSRDVMDAARAAGCEQVRPRSELLAHIAPLLA